MDFNPTEKQVRPLGFLHKPGAGQVITVDVVRPPQAIPLPLYMIDQAEAYAQLALGAPGELEFGMIAEYNRLMMKPHYLEFEGGMNYAPIQWENRRASLLGEIVRVAGLGWTELADFYREAFGFIRDAADNVLRTGADFDKEILRFYLDTMTATAPQIQRVASQLNLANNIAGEKLAGFKHSYDQQRRGVLDMIEQLVRDGAAGAAAAADALRQMAEKLAQMYVIVAVSIGLAAAAAAAIYFLPRPRR